VFHGFSQHQIITEFITKLTQHKVETHLKQLTI